MNPNLRADIVAFYIYLYYLFVTIRKKKHWRKTIEALAALKASDGGT